MVEILSKATAKYDQGEKLAEYKRLVSLQQIIFINQDEMAVETYERTDSPNAWLNLNFTESKESFVVEGKPISLEDLYINIEFAS